MKAPLRLWLVLAVSTLCSAQARADSASDVNSLSLEELMAIEVTSVSKRPQRLIDTPAAIFVITQEDIRRSGHTSIADMLRMVPGLSMGQANPYSWHVGIRGDEFQFSRGLLVLVDGRATYTTSFNGTFWDTVDMAPEDIDRIEVIRGTGASVWGANAVHGVINIIRKAPEDTQNAGVSVLAGNEERLTTSLRYAGSTDKVKYRFSGRLVDRDAFRARNDTVDQHDDFRQLVTSLRTDIELGPRDLLTLQGDRYSGERGGQFRRDFDTTGSNSLVSFETSPSYGGNAMMRWERRHSESTVSEVQAFWDYRYLDYVLVEDRRLHFDGEFRNRFQWGERQLVNWGFGHRHVKERLANTLNFMATPEKQDEAFYNFFAQDEIKASDSVRLTFGSKVEWNTYTGWEVQPTARALWNASEGQQVWGGVSRAVRVPSRLDRGEYVIAPAYVFNLPVQFRGSESFDSEVVTEYDLGYRLQASSTLFLDLTGFARRTQNFQVYIGVPPGPFATTYELRDSGERRDVGAEASVRWQPVERWKLTFGASRINLDSSRGAFTRSARKSSPPVSWSVLSYLDLPGNVELDAGYYYHGRLYDRFNTFLGSRMSGYYRLDLRLAWRPVERLELSVVGQNLLDRNHTEGSDLFQNAFYTTNLEDSGVQRSVLAKVSWGF